MLRNIFRVTGSSAVKNGSVYSVCRLQHSSSSSSKTSTPQQSQAFVGDPLTSDDEISELLSKPSWSVSSLLSSSTSSDDSNGGSSDGPVPPPPEEEITPSQLRHLLRLSALPEPHSADEEAAMLRTLKAQLHFVRKVQEVDTTGVAPLVAVRDERAAAREARAASQASLQSLAHLLAREEQVGRYRRIVKKKNGRTTTEAENEADAKRKTSDDGAAASSPDSAEDSLEKADDGIDWDPLERAPHRVGRFIKVNTEKS